MFLESKESIFHFVLLLQHWNVCQQGIAGKGMSFQRYLNRFQQHTGYRKRLQLHCMFLENIGCILIICSCMNLHYRSQSHKGR
jgi:hypothetical protein